MRGTDGATWSSPCAASASGGSPEKTKRPGARCADTEPPGVRDSGWPEWLWSYYRSRRRGQEGSPPRKSRVLHYLLGGDSLASGRYGGRLGLKFTKLPLWK